MEGIIVIGVLVVLAGVLFAFGGWQTARSLSLRREDRREQTRVAEANANAIWRVDVRHRARFTEVLVQRSAATITGWRPLDEPVLVTAIDQGSPSYEVELERAGTVARQRATQLNGFRDDLPTSS